MTIVGRVTHWVGRAKRVALALIRVIAIALAVPLGLLLIVLATREWLAWRVSDWCSEVRVGQRCEDAIHDARSRGMTASTSDLVFVRHGFAARYSSCFLRCPGDFVTQVKLHEEPAFYSRRGIIELLRAIRHANNARRRLKNQQAGVSASAQGSGSPQVGSIPSASVTSSEIEPNQVCGQ